MWLQSVSLRILVIKGKNETGGIGGRTDYDKGRGGVDDAEQRRNVEGEGSGGGVGGVLVSQHKMAEEPEIEKRMAKGKMHGKRARPRKATAFWRAVLL